MWIVIKLVTTTSTIIGCTVGPFDAEQSAEDYAASAVIGSLGYEKWIVRKLLAP